MFNPTPFRVMPLLAALFFFLFPPAAQADPNTFSGTYMSTIHVNDCNGNELGKSYLTLGICVPSNDGASSYTFSMDVDTGADSAILYQEAYSTANCQGDFTTTEVATYASGCYVTSTGTAFGAPSVVGGPSCDLSGFASIEYASEDACSVGSTSSVADIVRCQTYYNGACNYNADSSSPMYFSMICGESPFYYQNVFFDASTPTCGGTSSAVTTTYYGSCMAMASTTSEPNFFMKETCGTSTSSSVSTADCASSDDLDNNIALTEAAVGVSVIALILTIAVLILIVTRKPSGPMSSSS